MGILEPVGELLELVGEQVPVAVQRHRGRSVAELGLDRLDAGALGDEQAGAGVAEVCEVIITAPDPDWLVEFTRRLVTDRLCASGHNFAPIRTIYRWHGQVHDTTEGRVALRTLLPQIIERTKQDHPYEVPCVVAVPTIDGGPD